MTSSGHKSALWMILTLMLMQPAWGCQSSAEETSKRGLKLSMAIVPAPYSGLIAIADEKGYFKAQGLDLRLDYYPSGREALEAVCHGKAQVATVADIDFAAGALKTPCLRIIAAIGTTMGNQIVARRDRGIHKPSDLRGKKIGFSADTASEYFLYASLITEGIPWKAITAVNIPSGRQVDALVNGEVDAVSTSGILAFEANKRLGDRAVSWDSQNNLAYQWLLAADESLTRTPEPLKRLLKALIRAETFAGADREETQRIIVRKWGFDPMFLRECWPRTRLGVSFSQSIVTALQIYTRWQLCKAGKPAKEPDVINFLHPGVLDGVAPKLVTIFR